MAFEEALHSMYDPRLKPRLLYSVLATHLPDDRQPPKSPAQLSLAVSTIRRHHLLAEPSAARPAGGGKASDPYNGAVDAWIGRLMGLVTSTAPENCWAGVCLLGVTCQECPRQRFLESYSSWFQKLMVHLKPTDPVFVRGAACASLTDLLTRLGALIDFTGVRREGAALTGKLAQPILQLLGEEGSSSIWNEGIDLLCAMLKYFPTSLKQQFPQVETLLVAKLMEADCSLSLTQKFARCLALLPRSYGDAATWNSLIRRVLLAINSHLDDAFSGMEDATVAKEAVATLVPRGQEPSWLLGGLSVASAVAEGTKKFWQLLVPRISSLLRCCYFLLVNPYPVQVPVPLAALLALVTRILSVDGSSYRTASPLGATLPSSQQTALCSELPALHLCALDLLYGTLCGVRSQLLPRAADIVRLLTEYFRHCGSASLRFKLYNISKHLLFSMGVGMASALAPTIIDNALCDLKDISVLGSPYSVRTSRTSASAWATGMPGWNQATNPRKRKDPGSHQTIDFSPGTATSDGGNDINEVASPIALQIAALQAIEALLTVGGALHSDRWRPEVDSVVANVALNASSGILSPSLSYEDDAACMGGGHSFSSGAFQLAAYKAFLASLLSPCLHRPPYLSQGLAVFRKGRQEAGTEVAEFCAHALLALEPLIHPRCLPFASTAMAATVATARGSVSDTLIPQIHRSGLQFTESTSVPTAPSNAASLGYGNSFVPSMKVNHAGMHIEVEGDPYVQEDIDGWIVDYGGEQNILSEMNTTAIEGFVGLQTQDGAPSIVLNVLGEVNVTARQSAATDDQGLFMSMVADGLTDLREDSRPAPIGTNTLDCAMMGEVNEAPESCARNMGETGVSDRETNGFPLDASPHALTTPVSSADIPGHQDSIEGRSSLVKLSDARAENNEIVAMSSMAVEVTETPQELVHSTLPLPTLSGTTAFSFSASGTRTGSDSDSDAIPDIVDGDPDTE